MEAYLSKWEAVAGLHERGFTEDFELYGNHLLWIQQKVFLHPDEFSIIECHLFDDDQTSEFFIYGVMSNSYCAKGILITRDKKYNDKTPAILQNMLTSQNLKPSGYKYDYV